MDVEKTVEFMLRQQAQTTADLQQLGVTVERLSTSVDRIAQSQLSLVDVVRQLAEAQQRTDIKLSDLADKQQRTEDNLNALIKVVDDFVRRRNGGNNPSS